MASKINSDGRAYLRSTVENARADSSNPGERFVYIGVRAVRKNEDDSPSYYWGDDALEDLAVQVYVRKGGERGRDGEITHGLKTGTARSAYQAERHLALHRAVDARLAALRKRFGDSFGSNIVAWFVAVCEALNIKEVAVESYSTYNYGLRWLPPADAMESMLSRARDKFDEYDKARKGLAEAS